MSGRQDKKAASGTLALIILVVIIFTAVVLNIINHQKSIGIGESLTSGNNVSLNTGQESDIYDQIYQQVVQNLGLSTSGEEIIDNEDLDKEKPAKSELAIEDLGVVILENIFDPESFAEARFGYRDGLFYYSLRAQLPDLISGYYYEGWFIRQNPTQEVSIGILEKGDNGMYVLEFLSSRDFREYDKIMVTIEPQDNNPRPAELILEGKFKK